ncbi:MAG TPA: hypothetical protein VJ873_04260, partial [bacterium]|nr:hypothetical protein [bacterium]
VPDFINNRVLRYDYPITTGSVATHVWGQPNFTSGLPNGGSSGVQGNGFSFSGTDAYGTGVAIDSQGNLWVADASNNRVLRFPYNSSLGAPVTNPNLVLGRTDFIFNVAATSPTDLSHLRVPTSVRVDKKGTVYVEDIPLINTDPTIPDCQRYGPRVLVFNSPVTNGTPANGAITQYLGNPQGLELDPATDGIWVNDFCTGQVLLYVNNQFQKVLLRDQPTSALGGVSFTANIPNQVSYANGFSTSNYQMIDQGIANRGGIGIDKDGNMYVAGMGSYQDVWRFPAPPNPTPGVASAADQHVFKANQFNVFNDMDLADMFGPRGVAVSGNQLIVADEGRLVFYNNPMNATNDQQPVSYTGTTTPLLLPPLGGTVFGRIREDGANHLWAIYGSAIQCYQLPLTGSDPATLVINPPISVLGGGSLTWDTSLSSGEVTPDSSSNFLWVADPGNNRVFRIRNPLSGSPVVDIILGQTSLSGTLCNQTGNIITTNACFTCSATPSASTLFLPGSVRLDHHGNLYVSDNTLECGGNNRLLRWNASQFPTNQAACTFAIPATQVYGHNNDFTSNNCTDGHHEPCSPFEPAFTSDDSYMVVGTNPYTNNRDVDRFPVVLKDPIHGDTPVSNVNDFGSFPYASTFDSQDNLYVADLDRARVFIYKQPFASTTTSTSTPTISPTPTVGGGCGSSTAGLQLKEYTSLSGGNQASENFEVINTGSTPLNLSQISIKFWTYDTTGQNLVGAVNYAGGFGSTN